MAGRRIPAELLLQHWVHSHEEDTATEMVFRPADHPFPRSRGRRSFTLEAGGKLIEGRPGPTDRPEESVGTWQLTADGVLRFYRGGTPEPTRELQVESITRDRLVVRKPA